MQQTFTAKLAQISIAIACASMLAACGGGGSDGDSKSSTEQPGGGSNSGSGSDNSSKFTPSSEKTVAEDATTKSQYGDKVAPVTYTLHKQDHSVMTLNGQRYGDATNWSIDLGDIKLSSKDGGNNATWSGTLPTAPSKFFADEAVLMACAGTWDKYTNIAVSAAATKPASLAEMAGSYDEFSCGIEGINGDTAAFIVATDGSVKSSEGMVVDTAQLFSAKGWSPEPGFTMWGAAYMVNGYKIIILKDSENGETAQTVSISGPAK